MPYVWLLKKIRRCPSLKRGSSKLMLYWVSRLLANENRFSNHTCIEENLVTFLAIFCCYLGLYKHTLWKVIINHSILVFCLFTPNWFHSPEKSSQESKLMSKLKYQEKFESCLLSVRVWTAQRHECRQSSESRTFCNEKFWEHQFVCWTSEL